VKLLLLVRSALTSDADPDALERAAAEMTSAAAALVSIERTMLALSGDGTDAATLAAKQVGHCSAACAPV
jgi:hypothetical protein